MKGEKLLIQKLIDASRKNIYQLDEYPIRDVEAQIQIELQEILDLNQPEVLKDRLSYVGIGEESDYVNKWLKTKEGYVLAGIRHFGGNLDMPFVFMWPSFRIKNIERVVEELTTTFSIFKPKYYNFWIRPDCNNYDVKIVQQRFIGEINEMSKNNLRLIKPVEYYDWYENEYRKFHQLHPEFKYRIGCNDKSLMDESFAEGLLFLLTDDNETIGLISGEKEIFLRKPSVYLNEILISNEHRGQGYGSKLLGSFVNQLEAKYFTCHIDIENIPSTQTAIKSGQKVFSQECFVSI